MTLIGKKIESPYSIGYKNDFQIFTNSKLIPLGIRWGPLFQKFLIPFIQNALCQVWWKLEYCFNFVNVFSLFESHSPKKAMFQLNFVEISTVVLEKILYKMSIFFRYFPIISPWERIWPFIWKKKLNPLYPMMVLLKSCWNSSSLAKSFWSAPLLKITLGLLSYLKVGFVYVMWCKPYLYSVVLEE